MCASSGTTDGSRDGSRDEVRGQACVATDNRLGTWLPVSREKQAAHLTHGRSEPGIDLLRLQKRTLAVSGLWQARCSIRQPIPVRFLSKECQMRHTPRRPVKFDPLGDWKRTDRVTCLKCGAHPVLYRTPESSFGGHGDDEFKCEGCSHSWRVTGFQCMDRIDA